VITARSVAEARAWAGGLRATGARVALVPTMGALHAGHLALLQAARRHADAVAISVFVNPTQFGPGEDFARYPRDPARDASLAAGAGADLLFAPSVAEMYPEGAELALDPGPLGGILEGAVRPGHFRGVAIAVAKLLGALGPDTAVFGQKDAQQVLVVRALVRGLLLPVRVVCVPTVRDGDGLALSSRNVYLDAPARAAAPVLARALAAGTALLEAGERSAAAIEARMAATLAEEPLVRPDYAVAREARTLQERPVLQGRVLLLVAGRLGPTRLLDNACLEVGPEGCRPALP
jgi:pantoate--beta-alanine ligase